MSEQRQGERTPKFPQAVLFDFDGIIAFSETVSGWDKTVASWLIKEFQLQEVGGLSETVIATALLNTTRAVSHWSHAATLEQYPKELPSEKWVEFLSNGWPEEIQNSLSARIDDIVYQISEHRYTRTYREGIRELLQFLKKREVAIGLVSNTPCAKTSRDVIIEEGLSQYFDVETYSDELGLRKPNPQIIFHTLQYLQVIPSESWFVGDRLDRDIACAERAGVGTSVYMTGSGEDSSPYDLDLKADISVNDPYELLELFRAL